MKEQQKLQQLIKLNLGNPRFASWLAGRPPASQPEIDDSFKDRDSDRRKVMYCLRFQFGLCDSTTLFGGQHHDP